MDKYYKFEKEIAESVGIEGAIILQWVKDNETATYIKLEKVFSGLPFWTETDLVSHLLDLHQKGLLNVDLDKKRISKESNAKSKVWAYGTLSWKAFLFRKYSYAKINRTGNYGVPQMKIKPSEWARKRLSVRLLNIRIAAC